MTRLLALILAALAVPASAQVKPKLYDIWSVEIGMQADAIPNEFVDLACGTHGGPPSTALSGFGDFMKCKPEANGLREVYFRYDDELEYWARANELELETKLFSGTQIFDYPVVMSLLIDEQGLVRGIRIVTDPRVTDGSRDRNEFWTMGNFIRIRFGNDDWTCSQLPHDEGESAAGSYFIKERCEKRLDGRLYIYERRYYQRKGEDFLNVHTGQVNLNAFVSSTWFELLDVGIEAVPTAIQLLPRQAG